MLYIFSNSDDKSIHHIVCTDSDIRAGIIISRIYEREQISGEPVRVQFHNDTAATASVHGSAKRYEALKRTDKSNDTFEEEFRAKVAELSKTVKPDVVPVVPYNDIDAFLYSANVNELVTRYYKDKLNSTRLDVIKEVARNNNYDVDKFVKDVVTGHEAAYTAPKASIKKSNGDKDEKMKICSRCNAKIKFDSPNHNEISNEISND